MLTDTKIRHLKPSPRDRWISDGNKLYLRVRATGGLTWILRRRKQDGGNRKLGNWPAMTLAQARIAASKETGKVTADLTLQALLDEWYADMVAKRYRRPKEVAAYFDRMEPALLATKLRDLDRVATRHSLKRYADERGPVAANRLMSILKTALTFARDVGYIEASPLDGMSKEIVGGAEVARARVLTDGEISALWNTESQQQPLLRFLLLTGCRIGEAQQATWADIHGDKWHIPAERSKSRKAQWIALSRQALHLLGELKNDRELVFGMTTTTGVQSWLRRWCKREKIAPAFTPHDLRRTCATRMNDLGVMPHIVEKILGHSLQGVMAVYNRAEYAPERMAGAQLWADELDHLVGVPAIKNAA
jgi:integrase